MHKRADKLLICSASIEVTGEKQANRDPAWGVTMCVAGQGNSSDGLGMVSVSAALNFCFCQFTHKWGNRPDCASVPDTL